MHEIGHMLGYGHDEGGVMAATLEPGTRPSWIATRSPSATPPSVAPTVAPPGVANLPAPAEVIAVNVLVKSAPPVGANSPRLVLLAAPDVNRAGFADLFASGAGAPITSELPPSAPVASAVIDALPPPGIPIATSASPILQMVGERLRSKGLWVVLGSEVAHDIGQLEGIDGVQVG